MIRRQLAPWLVLLAACGAQIARGDSSPRTLVLPLRSIGVSDTTITVSRELLIGSLQDLGVEVAAQTPAESPLPAGPDACDEPACAVALGREHGAARVIYGSLSKLGGKIIARLDVILVDETAPYYRDQLTALSEEDLDRVMRRFAEGIAAGRPNSDRASVESVTQAEAQTPARRATRTGFGVRAGFLFPTAGSFGGADRLTDLHAAFKYEIRDYLFETTTLLGFTWGKGDFDWTIFDLSASRIFGTRDLATYLGAGIGVHTVTVQARLPGTSPYYYPNTVQKTETAPTLDLVAGIMVLRTYDFTAVLEVRYHYVVENFDSVDGKGANGVLVTIGTTR